MHIGFPGVHDDRLSLVFHLAVLFLLAILKMQMECNMC